MSSEDSTPEWTPERGRDRDWQKDFLLRNIDEERRMLREMSRKDEGEGDRTYDAGVRQGYTLGLIAGFEWVGSNFDLLDPDIYSAYTETRENPDQISDQIQRLLDESED